MNRRKSVMLLSAEIVHIARFPDQSAQKVETIVVSFR